MEAGEVYVTIGLDKHGDIVEVRLKGGDAIRPKDSPRGPLQKGLGAPGCEEVVKMLVHELLACRKKTSEGSGAGQGGGSGSGGSGSGGSGSGSGTDPCCYRDPATGRIWCWC